MVVSLSASERQLLRQAQGTCRGKAGYVPLTGLLLLDRGRTVAAIAEDLGLAEAMVYRYAQTCRLKGLVGYLAAEQPGYWDLLSSAQLAGLCQELDQRRYPDCRLIAEWLADTVRRALLGFGPDGPAPPTGLLLQPDHGRAL